MKWGLMVLSVVLGTFVYNNLTTGNQNTAAASLQYGLHGMRTEFNQNRDMIDGLDQRLQNLLDELNKLVTMQHADQQTLDEQMNKIAQDLGQLNNGLLDQPYAHRARIHHLQGVQGSQTHTASSGIQVSAGDSRVPTAKVSDATNIINQISLPVLKENVGFPSSRTHVILFSSKTSYANALLKSGVPSSQIDSIATKTGGLTIGSDVWIPLYNQNDRSDLANVLTHELTHVVLNQKGLGDQLPTWINEGIAWHDGLLGQSQVNSNKVRMEKQALTKQVYDAAAQGSLLPLSASENDILGADYNVEWEDAMAVQQLMDTYGTAAFQAFLQDAAQDGIDRSFVNHFQMDRTAYEQQFVASLHK